jgi:chemotaxis protein CheC
MNSQEEKMDALREIAHIGAGNASNSLSQMTGKNIDVDFPEIKKHRIEKVPEILGDQDQLVTAASIQMHTELNGERKDNLGRIALIMDYDSSKKLATIISPEEEDKEGLTEMDISSLKELENVLAGTCLEAISDVIDYKLYESTPFFHVDMVGAVMQGMVLDMVETHDEILVFKTQFSTDEEIDAYFMFFFTEDGYECIIENLDQFK